MNAKGSKVMQGRSVLAEIDFGTRFLQEIGQLAVNCLLTDLGSQNIRNEKFLTRDQWSVGS